jgi:hypothetical protein
MGVERRGMACVLSLRILRSPGTSPVGAAETSQDGIRFVKS